MTTTASPIDQLISEQVSSGTSATKIEAEQKLAASLVERELDRRIAKGRQDIKDGNFTPVNEQTTTEFVARLSKKIIPQK